MADKDSTIKDLLIALYNRNEQYHDFKDTVIWLAASAYLGFSIAIVAWILNPTNSFPWNGWYIIVFLLLVFASTFIFIIRQNWQKCISVQKTESFNRLIVGLAEKNKEMQYEDLVDLTNPSKSVLGLCSFFGRGWPGVMILSVVSLFFVAQFIAVFHKADFSFDSVWLGILIGAGNMVVIALVVFSIHCRKRKKAFKDLEHKISNYINEKVPKDLKDILKQSDSEFEKKLTDFTKKLDKEIVKKMKGST